MKALRITLLVYIFLAVSLVPFWTHAETYYVDVETGDDDADGTTEGSAWQSLSKVNGYAFLPGDVVLLRRGQTWRETLRPMAGGDSTATLRFSAFGEGALPRISGGELLNGGWTSIGGNLWSLDAPDPLMVFFWREGEEQWGHRKDTQDEVVQDFEFSYQGNAIVVYATADPASYYENLERPERNFAVELDYEYIHIELLELDSSFEAGIRTNNAHHARISECEIHHIGNTVGEDQGDGIYHLSSESSIDHNKIYECGAHLIYISQYDPYLCRDNVIEHNTLVNNYYTAIDISRVDMDANSGGHHVRYNLIYDLEQQLPGRGGIGIQTLGTKTGEVEYLVTDVHIYGNILMNLDSIALNHGRFGDDIFVYNNTIVGCGRTLWCVEAEQDGREQTQEAPQHFVFRNNISLFSEDADVFLGNGTNKIFDHNIYYRETGGFFFQWQETSYEDFEMFKAATGQETATLLVDPLVHGDTAETLTLDLSSPAIDTGAALEAPYDVDVVGVMRPQGAGWDIGAHEYRHEVAQLTCEELGGSCCDTESTCDGTRTSSNDCATCCVGGTCNAFPQAPSDSGCGCQTTSVPPWSPWMLFVLLVLYRRRRIT